jgi:hypothetical protein
MEQARDVTRPRLITVKWAVVNHVSSSPLAITATTVPNVKLHYIYQMAIQTSGLTESGCEREMSIHLRGLVDTVLEEGNLDSAITLLDRLRSPAYKPYRFVSYNALNISLKPFIIKSARTQSALPCPVSSTHGGRCLYGIQSIARHHSLFS